MALPWTKFQDFYLRLGFLKVLVAALEKSRTSVANELVHRRLRTPLFEAAQSHAPKLWETVRTRVDWHWYAKEHDAKDYRNPTVAESLLVAGGCPSLLFAITRATEYKILDWGHDVGLVGRGNQISERGLFLRELLPQEAVQTFMRGDVLAWNPFVVTPQEKLFFFYHLCEIDQVTADLVRRLGTVAKGTVLEARDAGRLLCRSLHQVLARGESKVRPSELPAMRTARELATTIAEEMDLVDEMPFRVSARPRPPKPMRRTGSSSSNRKTTKNTDHQTIPRFEQLADLGFVRKHGGEFGSSSSHESRRRWRWTPTELCTSWADAVGENSVDVHLLKTRFARAASDLANATRTPTSAAAEDIVRWTWNAYRVVRRPIGHTPLESVALHAMIHAATEGQIVELDDLHRYMLLLKRTGIAADKVQFAGGNDLAEMFVRLTNGFVEEVTAAIVAGQLPSDLSVDSMVAQAPQRET